MLRIGAVAKQAGVSPDTLRHYERLGLLPRPSRSESGYREYGPEALPRVRLVRRALACGFTLAELSQVLGRRDRGEAPCRRVRELAGIKLAAMERETKRLQERCRALRRTLRDWDARLAKTPRGRQARLLDHLDAVPGRDCHGSPKWPGHPLQSQ